MASAVRSWQRKMFVLDIHRERAFGAQFSIHAYMYIEYACM